MIVKIRAKEVPDIPRTDQPFLATAAFRQPQTHGRDAIYRDGWTDSWHVKKRLQTAFLHLVFHSLVKLFEGVGRRRRGALDFASRLEALANTMKNALEADRLVVVGLVQRRRLSFRLLSAKVQRRRVVDAIPLIVLPNSTAES